jgi:hypothetical protein
MDLLRQTQHTGVQGSVRLRGGSSEAQTPYRQLVLGVTNLWHQNEPFVESLSDSIHASPVPTESNKTSAALEGRSNQSIGQVL